MGHAIAVRPDGESASNIDPGMSLYFEELDYRATPIGALSLRRRRELSLACRQKARRSSP
jgi:hypothetical protein